MISPAGAAGAVGLQTLGFRTSLRAFLSTCGGVDSNVHYFRDDGVTVIPMAVLGA